MPKMWGGRFKKGTARSVETFTSSIHFDRRLYNEDILGSIAHVKGLQRAGVLTSAEASKLVAGLKQILIAFQKGKVQMSDKYEDVHMNIEALLTARLGELGKKVHTGRSRNDQVATDLRLYLKKEIKGIVGDIVQLQKTILKQAEKNKAVYLPGFTHLQHAQPVLLAHHFLAYIEMLQRDKGRLTDALKRMDELPLGAAALAGTAYPIDRKKVAEELGFSRVTNNSMEAVSDRDFVVEFLSAASLAMIHLSRLSEELVLWMSPEFNFISLSDEYTTGSSLMPQKKNPDCAELIRGKSGRVVGALLAILMVLKGLPLAYNRDLQEDKERLFDAVDTVARSLQIMSGMIAGLTVNIDIVSKAASAQYTLATDLADHLVKQGVSFREAHGIVGKIVAKCISMEKELEELTLADLKKFSPKLDKDVFKVLTVEKSLAARKVIGGTAPGQVLQQLKRWQRELN